MDTRSQIRATRGVPRGRTHRAQGFTLVELIIVMTIIGILAAVAIPYYLRSVRTAREVVLRENLATMRYAIGSYTADKDKSPQGLDDLVQAGYLKKIPEDPITSRTDTWVTGPSESPVDINDSGGIGEVHSGANQSALDGSNYRSW